MTKIIAIIPARGCSKRIPRKNIKEFHGVPMIQHTISMAKSSSLFDQIIVSTDDTEIANIAKRDDVKVHQRNRNLANDFTTTVEVISNILKADEYLALSEDTIVVCLYPVTPLLQYRRVKEAIDYLKDGNSTYIFPVHEFESPVERGFKLSLKNHPKIFFQKYFSKRTQDIEPTFHDAGQFYVASIDTWREMKPIISKNSKVIKLEKFETVDVDNQTDWNFVEELYSIRKKKD